MYIYLRTFFKDLPDFVAVFSTSVSLLFCDEDDDDYDDYLNKSKTYGSDQQKKDEELK
jgi:hypothetical protein